MRLIGPKCDQLGPSNIVYLKSPNEKQTLFVYTRLGFESWCKQIPKHLNEKTILLTQWSENCRLYMFWRILDLR